MKIKYQFKDAMSKLNLKKLRKHQIKPIDDIMDNHDVIVIRPTGAGKSAIYQLPAILHENKLTIVIEPTLALMHDQVNKLKTLGIKAEYIDSTLTSKSITSILHKLSKGKINILYVTPERLHIKSFINALKDLSIYMIVIDECHCVLSWGYSFRPDYLRIGKFIESLENRPIITAFTATASPKEIDDISDLLNMNFPAIHTMSIDRKNLILIKEEIAEFKDTMKEYKQRFSHMKSYIKKYWNDASIIIYCNTCNMVDAVYNFLENKFPNDICKCHSELNPAKRSKHELQFLNGEKKIMIATSAFGMGVDKGDIGLIIHFNMPISIGDYYQQVGRAGRDGRTAHCITLYNNSDYRVNKSLLKSIDDTDEKELAEDRLNDMKKLIYSDKCLIKQILQYFGEEKDKNCKHCTNCQKNRRV